jgi:predicted ATP-dependent endonuclease of OLD family
VLTGIKFENFRGFSSFDAALKPVTVLVGPNSSGKTSVLHAARMVVEALDLAIEHGTPHDQPNGTITVPPSRA